MNDKIYFIISSLGGGGAERVCVTLANELKKRGFNISILIFNKNSNRNQYMKYVDKKIEICSLDASSTLNGYFKLLKFMYIHRPAKILAFNESISAICIMMKKILGLDTKIILRNVNTLSIQKQQMKSKREKLLFNYSMIFYNQVDHIIAQSQGMADDIINNFGISNLKVSIINNPVATHIQEFSTMKYPNLYNNEAFLFVGRLEQQKGFSYLINAIKICKQRGVDIKLDIIGTGSLKDEIEKDIKQNNLETNIKLLGLKENIEKYFINSKGVILSSIFEGFPNVLVESITLGIPVISFDCPSGPKEIIIDGINGFLVNYKDEEDLADKIIKSHKFNWDTNKIKETSKRYHIENIIDQYSLVMDKIFNIRY